MVRRIVGNRNTTVTNTQTNQINTSDGRAEVLLNNLMNDLDLVFNQPGRGNARAQLRIDAWNSNSKLVTWLGVVNNNEQIVTVRRRVRSLIRRIAQTGSVYEVFGQNIGGCQPPRNAPAGSVVNAFVNGRVPAQRINLCPSFFYNWSYYKSIWG